MMFALPAVLGAAIGEHEQQAKVERFNCLNDFVKEQIGADQCVFAVIKSSVGDLGIGIDSGTAIRNLCPCTPHH